MCLEAGIVGVEAIYIFFTLVNVSFDRKILKKKKKKKKKKSGAVRFANPESITEEQ